MVAIGTVAAVSGSSVGSGAFTLKAMANIGCVTPADEAVVRVLDQIAASVLGTERMRLGCLCVRVRLVGAVPTRGSVLRQVAVPPSYRYSRILGRLCGPAMPLCSPLIISLAAGNTAGPDALLARFRKYEYLYSQGELDRVAAILAKGPEFNIRELREETEKFDRLIQQVKVLLWLRGGGVVGALLGSLLSAWGVV